MKSNLATDDASDAEMLMAASLPGPDALDHALAPIVVDLDAVLSEPAALSGRGPDAALYREAIRRHGRAAGEVGGRVAMRRVMARAAELAPERSRRREVVMALAWAGLPGW